MEKRQKIKKILSPIKSNFDFHDLLQVIIGACILAVPVGFTKEVWELGESLPILNIIILIFLTLLFICIFSYFHYHKEHMHTNPSYHLSELAKRTLVTYIFSFIIVAILLSLIQVTPWVTEPLVALKRIVIVTFPSSIGAAISDVLK